MNTRAKLLAATALCGLATLLLPPNAAAQSSCADLGGSVDPAGTCHVHADGASFRMDLAFPSDYPDEGTLTDFVTRRRHDFLATVTEFGGSSFEELDIIGHPYHSAATRTIVLHIGSNTGVHPVTTYQTFTFDVTTHAPVTIESLFAPGSQPLSVLNPIIAPEFEKRGALLPADELTLNDYRSFAITDDAVLFFFDQDWPMDHVSGPLTVTVPRTELASILA